MTKARCFACMAVLLLVAGCSKDDAPATVEQFIRLKIDGEWHNYSVFETRDYYVQDTQLNGNDAYILHACQLHQKGHPNQLALIQFREVVSSNALNERLEHHASADYFSVFEERDYEFWCDPEKDQAHGVFAAFSVNRSNETYYTVYGRPWEDDVCQADELEIMKVNGYEDPLLGRGVLIQGTLSGPAWTWEAKDSIHVEEGTFRLFFAEQ